MIVFVSSFLDYIRRFVLELLQRREVVSRLFERKRYKHGNIVDEADLRQLSN